MARYLLDAFQPEVGATSMAAARHMTIGERVVETRGRSTGFDYLRVALAIAVVCWHSIITSYGPASQQDVYNGPFRALFASILPLFFALSGFLVAGSLERNPSIAKFIGLRAIRILPALACETILSALILGPVLTTLPLSKYFSAPEFRHYLWNAVGYVHFRLPGLFLANPASDVVNGQLWTVPFELICYISLAALALFGIARKARLILAISVAVQLLLILRKAAMLHGVIIVNHGPLPGFSLVMCFLAGLTIYFARDAVPYSRLLAGLSCIMTVVFLSIPFGDYLVCYPAAYLTIWLGLCNPRANALHKLGDLSYGIFLYGFPVQQVVASAGNWSHHWYVNLALALPLSCLVALASWRLIERPSLRLKNHLKFLEPVDASVSWLQGHGRAARNRVRVAYKARSFDTFDLNRN